MKHKLVWNLSILIISVTFITISCLSFLQRNIFFNDIKERNALAETFMLQRSISRIMNANIATAFDDVNQYFKKNRNNQVKDDLWNASNLIQKHPLLSGIDIKDIRSLSKNENFCTHETMYSIDNDHYAICSIVQDKNVYLKFSYKDFLQFLYQDLEDNYPTDRQPNIHYVSFLSNTILINISKSQFEVSKSLFQNAYRYLDDRIYFRMFWKGVQVFPENLILSTDNKYYLFYDPLMKWRHISFYEWVMDLFFLLLGFLVFSFGFDFGLFRYAHIQEYEPAITQTAEEHTSVSSLTYKARDLPELRELISTVIEQEKKLSQGVVEETNNHSDYDKFSSNLFKEPENDDANLILDEDDGMNHYDELIQHYEEIQYILSCRVTRGVVDIQVVGRSNHFQYQIPQDHFLLSRLVGERDFTLLSKEAGKTTAMKKILLPSFINPLSIESVLISSHQNHYILILFSNTVSEDLANLIGADIL